MKKIVMLVIIVAILSITTIFALGNNHINPIAKYNIYKKRFSISKEEFLEDVETRNIGVVMFSANVAKSFDKDIEEIYQLMDANNDDMGIVGEILRSESQRTEPLYLPSKPTEAEAAKITERLNNGTQPSNPRGNTINNATILDTSKKGAIEIYNESKFLYAFDEEGLLALLEIRPAGEVLLAGNLAHNFNMTIEYIISVFDEYESDYNKAYIRLHEEWMAYQREYNN